MAPAMDRDRPSPPTPSPVAIPAVAIPARATSPTPAVAAPPVGCPSPPPPRLLLPPELRDLVIDVLAEDKDTAVAALRTSALVHSSWLPRARHHLFRRVSLSRGPRGPAFRALLDANPALARSIRELEISGTAFTDASPVEVYSIRWPTLHVHDTPEQPPSASSSSPHCWLELVLPRDPSTLSRVRCLQLTNLSISPDLAAILGRYFASVSTVILDVCRAPTFRDFGELPRVLPRVQCLHIIGAHWLRAALPAPLPPDRPPTLNTLVLSGKNDATTIINWLVGAHRHTALSTIYCDIVGTPSATALRTLLVALGPSLKQLAIGFPEARDPTEVLNSTGLSLDPCTGLQHLSIHCSPSDARCGAPSLSWTLLLLSKLASPSLRALSFFIAAPHVGALNLEVLAVVLAHGRFVGLRRLVFHVRGWVGVSGGVEGVEERLRERLVDLGKRGVVLRVLPQGTSSSTSASVCYRRVGSATC